MFFVSGSEKADGTDVDVSLHGLHDVWRCVTPQTMS